MRHLIVALFFTTTFASYSAFGQSFSVPTPSESFTLEKAGHCKAANCPAVILLSGAKGFGAPAYDRITEALNAAGLDSYRLHILSPVDLGAIANAGSARARIDYYDRRYAVWQAGVRAAAAQLASMSMHGGRVGLLGISLGAQIAISAVADTDAVDALVLVDGGFPAGQKVEAEFLPPLLLVWGGSDTVFNPNIARNLHELALNLGNTATLDIYEGGSHDFFLKDNQNAENAQRKAAAFLANQLQAD
ncbi:hypothetical protein ASD83_13715 [Devosia sp. Root685]|uniref:dienelactone hydrolase family protein n=1 Tax=Devosia sp. Root685 TaxID=1736587 RepID=UPI0006FECA90|nr:dienelactone hydrolase family protein [Devosia sp. Root685]KRA98106.1 hypothetical protein ASD83_13715 [Devosia sp. Root685]